MRTLRLTVAGGVVVAGLAAFTPAALASSPGATERGLDRYTGQQVFWKDCARGAEDEIGQRLDEIGARCAEVRVPLDYTAPGGRSLKVAISRIEGDPVHRRGILLANPGGPGGQGLDFGIALKSAMKDVADRYDLIGFDPRFVGRSSPLTCGQIPWWLRSPGFRRSDFDKAVDMVRDIARRCQDHGDNAALFPHASTRNVARDMDVIQAALGAPKLSYYGASYGADLGAVYTQMFPGNADRIVLDSSTDPAKTQYALMRSVAAHQEAALDEWAAWTARRSHHYRLGRTAAQVRRSLTRVLARAERQPIKIGEHRLDHHLFPVFLRTMVNHEDDNAVLARSVRGLADAANGASVTPEPELAGFLTLFTGAEVSALVPGVTAAMCADAGWPAGGWPRDPERYWRNIQRSQPVFGPLNNTISPCAFWRTPPREPATEIGNTVPLLMVQAVRDNNTPYPDGQALHRRLTGSRLVTAHMRAHGVYGRGAAGQRPSPCADKAVNAYLRDGTLPAEDIDCPDPF
ncbi:TAP-like protein [Actinomadura pelletieri DSM 43383]|uniref:TAP-like protein n=1 Tax=Actinomadura pelletieri DSM 43383 TaxID=1120940 RepID=A0A495QU38_9ACTN|nr:alpha/beta hydrolase [Actinomadura pelletieri]RKS76975.1 TAP-like protein [Actinomadura pelletieri DSM 43383]